jgi:hypothetical protein
MAARRTNACIGAVNLENPIASSTNARASAWASGSKFEMKFPGWASSLSVCLS